MGLIEEIKDKIMKANKHEPFQRSEATQEIHIAVGNTYCREKRNLKWALKNFPQARIVIIHVHGTSKWMPFMGAKILYLLANDAERALHQRRQREEMLQLLCQYRRLCANRKVAMHHIDDDDVLTGIQRLVISKKITSLVMGSRSMSQEASLLQHCQILLVRNGRYISTIEAIGGDSNTELTTENSTNQDLLSSEHTETPLNHKESQELPISTPEAETDELSVWEAEAENNELPIRTVDAQSDESDGYSTALSDLEEEATNQDTGRTATEDSSDNTRKSQGSKRDTQLELLMAKLCDMERKMNVLEERTSQAKDSTPSKRRHARYKNSTDGRDQKMLAPEPIIEFSERELRQATNNFSPRNKIGEGGYGPVYIGELRGIMVAIKVLNKDGKQSTFEYEQEVLVLSSLGHPNIIKLIGFCHETMSLIYEYLPSGNLENKIRCRHDRKFPWKDRIRIIIEQRSALLHLHSSKPYAIVHSDLKLTNILLDANDNSRLGDFGTARLLRQDMSGEGKISRMTRPMGTIGYMDPEFFRTQKLTPQSDIYSFGIIILQLLTGWEELSIISKVEGKLENEGMLDDTAGNWPVLQAEQLLRLALRCCAEPKDRPNLASDEWRVLDELQAIAEKSRKFSK